MASEEMVPEERGAPASSSQMIKGASGILAACNENPATRPSGNAHPHPSGEAMGKKRTSSNWRYNDTELPQEIKQVLSYLDKDGDGTLNSGELIAAVEAHKADQHHKKRLHMVIFGLLGFLVVLLVGTFAVTFMAIEITKEMRAENGGVMKTSGGEVVKVASSDYTVAANGTLVSPQGGDMRIASSDMSVGTDGALMNRQGSGSVQTADVESFASLFDLPSYDITTLGKVGRLNIQLGNGDEISFKIHQARKHKGRRAATFTSVDGSKIVIDGQSMVATCNVDGATQVVNVTTVSRNARRLKEENGYLPRLLPAKDFFTAENGFAVEHDGSTSRRLTTDNSHRGWASVGILSAQAVLDMQNAQAGTAYTTIYIGGASKLIQVDSAQAFGFAAYYNSGQNSGRVRLNMGQEAGYLIHDWPHAVTDGGKAFVFTSEGVLRQCSDADGVEFPLSVIANEANNGVALVEATMTDQSNYVAEVDYTSLIMPADLATIEDLIIPTQEECLAVLQAAVTAVPASTGARRLAWPVDHEEPQGPMNASAYVRELRADATLYKFARHAQCAYKDAHEQCSETTHSYVEGNAFMTYSSDPPCTFSFRGSGDKQDWIANFNIIPTLMHSKIMHMGFIGEFNDLKKYITDAPYKSANANCDCYNMNCHFVGHSLGGAIAGVAWHYFQRTSSTVYSFGAPKIYLSGTSGLTGFIQLGHGACYQSPNTGARVYHETDPVPQIPPWYTHHQAGTKIVGHRRRRNSLIDCHWVWAGWSSHLSCESIFRRRRGSNGGGSRHFQGNSGYGCKNPTGLNIDVNCIYYDHLMEHDAHTGYIKHVD